jgi:hypothetical protein
MDSAADRAGSFDSYEARVRSGLHAFLAVLDAFPAHTQTLLVEIIGAGPRAAQRRDEVLDLFADYLLEENRRHAAEHGAPVFRSREDAFAVIGAIVELVSRHLRTGEPQRAADLEDVMARVLLGTLAGGARG